MRAELLTSGLCPVIIYLYRIIRHSLLSLTVALSTSLSLFLSVPPSFFVSLSVYLYSVDFWEKINILQIWRCLYQIYISISVASKTADADRSINIYLRNVLYVLIQASIYVH